MRPRIPVLQGGEKSTPTVADHTGQVTGNDETTKPPAGPGGMGEAGGFGRRWDGPPVSSRRGDPLPSPADTVRPGG